MGRLKPRPLETLYSTRRNPIFVICYPWISSLVLPVKLSSRSHEYNFLCRNGFHAFVCPSFHFTVTRFNTLVAPFELWRTFASVPEWFHGRHSSSLHGGGRPLPEYGRASLVSKSALMMGTALTSAQVWPGGKSLANSATVCMRSLAI